MNENKILKRLIAYMNSNLYNVISFEEYERLCDLAEAIYAEEKDKEAAVCFC